MTELQVYLIVSLIYSLGGFVLGYGVWYLGKGGGDNGYS